MVDTARKRALEDGLQEVPRLIAAHAPLRRCMFGDPADMKGIMTRLLLSTAIVVALTASASAQFFNPGPKAGGSSGPSVTCPKGSFYQNSSGKCVPPWWTNQQVSSTQRRKR